MATRKICDECQKETEKFASRSELEYKRKVTIGARTAQIRVRLSKGLKLCPSCVPILFKRALQEARDPLVTPRAKKPKAVEDQAAQGINR